MNSVVRNILEKLADCLKNDTYQEVENERFELKSSLPNSAQSKTAYESINAFLNTKVG